jgi:hypothetical protein
MPINEEAAPYHGYKRIDISGLIILKSNDIYLSYPFNQIEDLWLYPN